MIKIDRNILIRKDINMSEQQELITTDNIQSLVYVIRGQQVMLDSDLARIYGYDIKAFNQQVKRNINRFPEDFMFELTNDEMKELSRSQFVTSIQTEGVKGGRTYKIKAFTEQGIYMLATVLRGELAEKQSIAIMRAFKEMKHYIQQNQQFATKAELNSLSSQMMLLSSEMGKGYLKLETRIDEIQEVINQNFFTEQGLKEWTILKGQKFEANAAYIHIYSQAKESIYVIDDYPSIKTLELLAHKPADVSVMIFTDNKASQAQRLHSIEVENFNTEYPTLNVKPNGETHDRYIILDFGTENEQIYLCGPSSKDAGNKVGTIVQLNDRPIFYPLINEMLSKDDLIL